MNKLNATMLIVQFIFLFCACGRENKEDTSLSVKKVPIEDAIGITKIGFSDTVLNLGNVSAASTTTVYLKIFNKGAMPIIISDVKSTCGCTVPKFPTRPIIKEDSIEINFTSRGNIGHINKKIRIYTNTIPQMQEILITANVTK